MPNDADELEPLVDAVEEPLDEMLHHTTEQTLRLAHLVEGVGELKASVGELGEAVATGFVELRASVMQVAHGAAPAADPVPVGGLDDTYKQHLSERLDDLERRVTSAKQRLGLVAVFSVVQLAIGGVLIALALGYLNTNKAPPPAPVVAAPPPAPVVAPEPASPPPAPLLGREPPRRKGHRR